MIIWGSKGKETIIGSGQFYCPRCATRRSYKQKSIDKYFTLYFIPLVRTSKIAEFVECTTCLTPFETSILQFDKQRQDAINEFVGLVGQEVEAGLPIQAIYGGLIENGASREQANLVISMVTKGKLKECSDCKLFYGPILHYCSKCGAKLKDVT